MLGWWSEREKESRERREMCLKEQTPITAEWK